MTDTVKAVSFKADDDMKVIMSTTLEGKVVISIVGQNRGISAKINSDNFIDCVDRVLNNV